MVEARLHFTSKPIFRPFQNFTIVTSTRLFSGLPHIYLIDRFRTTFYVVVRRHADVYGELYVIMPHCQQLYFLPLSCCHAQAALLHIIEM